MDLSKGHVGAYLSAGTCSGSFSEEKVGESVRDHGPMRRFLLCKDFSDFLCELDHGISKVPMSAVFSPRFTRFVVLRRLYYCSDQPSSSRGDHIGVNIFSLTNWKWAAGILWNSPTRIRRARRQSSAMAQKFDRRVVSKDALDVEWQMIKHQHSREYGSYSAWPVR